MRSGLASAATPLEPAPEVLRPEFSEEGGESGWFCQPFVCREPDRIPLGLPARDSEGLDREPSREPREELPLPVYERAARFRTEPLDRPVDVPLVHLVRLFRLAWFCHSSTMPFVRIDAPDGRSYFAAEAGVIHPAVPALVSDADARMAALGFGPVGDVAGEFFTSHVYRGYSRPGGDTWALLMIEASTLENPDGAWDFVTGFEKGAVLSSTRGALSKDEPKRKIFRVLDPAAPPEVLLAKHDARKGELSKKWGSPVIVSADLKGLAKEAANLVKRTIG